MHVLLESPIFEEPVTARDVVARARVTWPLVSVDESCFVAHLQALGWDAELPPFALQVYLTCACSRRDDAAYRIFDCTYAGVIKRAIKNVCRAAHRVEEVQQAVREKLFVGPAPGIAKYSGRSSLEAWLRLVVRRMALDAERAARRRVRRDARALAPYEAVGSALETELDRRRYAALLRTALARAFSGLPPRDCDLLRLHYASGVGIDALGSVFGVHRATAARWLEKIQNQLRAGLRASLRESSGVRSDDELRELLLLADREELCNACWVNVLQLPAGER